MKNLEDVFVANGYDREDVRETLKEKDNTNQSPDENEPSMGRVTIPYVRGLSEEFKRFGKARGFNTYFTPGMKLRSISKLQQTPLGNKRSNVVYRIECKCEKARYTGETKRRFTTLLSEHQASVRLTKADLDAGDMQSAEKRMGKEDGGIARHSTECTKGIDWDSAKVIGLESDWKKRKVLEGIESLRSQHEKKLVLNNHDQLYPWRGLLNEFFIEDNGDG